MILGISQSELPLHYKGNYYSIIDYQQDNRKSGEKQFDYLNPKTEKSNWNLSKSQLFISKNRSLYKSRKIATITFSDSQFGNVVSVIIPVFNRMRTIADAVNSALSQNLSIRSMLLLITILQMELQKY